jgi:hypothetical protein
MLGDERFAINAWSSLQIDAVGAMDAQEYDSTIFGVLEVSPLIFLMHCSIISTSFDALNTKSCYGFLIFFTCSCS